MRLAFTHCPFRACVPSGEACQTNEMTEVSPTRVCQISERRPMMRISFAVAVTAAAGVLLVQPASGQSAPEQLGEVHFSVSCSPDAQRQFDRAISILHSFWYE